MASSHDAELDVGDKTQDRAAVETKTAAKIKQIKNQTISIQSFRQNRSNTKTNYRNLDIPHAHYIATVVHVLLEIFFLNERVQ